MCSITILETQNYDSPTAELSNYDLDCSARALGLSVSFLGLYESSGCIICCSASWAAPMRTPYQAEVLAPPSEGKSIKRCLLLQWPEAITPEFRDAWFFPQVLTDKASEGENNGHPMKLLRCGIKDGRYSNSVPPINSQTTCSSRSFER